MLPAEPRGSPRRRRRRRRSLLPLEERRHPAESSALGSRSGRTPRSPGSAAAPPLPPPAFPPPLPTAKSACEAPPPPPVSEDGAVPPALGGRGPAALQRSLQLLLLLLSCYSSPSSSPLAWRAPPAQTSSSPAPAAAAAAAFWSSSWRFFLHSHFAPCCPNWLPITPLTIMVRDLRSPGRRSQKGGGEGEGSARRGCRRLPSLLLPSKEAAMGKEGLGGARLESLAGESPQSGVLGLPKKRKPASARQTHLRTPHPQLCTWKLVVASAPSGASELPPPRLESPLGPGLMTEPCLHRR